MGLKRCSKCGNEYPATTEYFGLRDGSKDGFHTWCKKCLSEYKKQNRRGNIETVSEQHKRYYKTNKERCNEYNKEYYQTNKERLSAKGKEYCKKNAAHISERNKQYKHANKEWYAAYMGQYGKDNKERLAEYRKKYSEKNRETLAEHKKQYAKDNEEWLTQYHKRYAKDNAERFNLRSQRRRATKRALPATLTLEQWEAVQQHFDYRCAYCGKEEPLAQEHFVPLSKGGAYTQNNIVPACKSCNSSKGAKDFFDWYPRQPFYSKSRERRILKHLNYKGEPQQLALSF